MGNDPTLWYEGRRLSEGYPGLDALSLEWFQTALARQPDDTDRVQMEVSYLDRLIDVGKRRNVLVVGCGPTPTQMRILRDMGFSVVGVEPAPAYVAAARRHLGDESSVLSGRAEELPVEDGSHDIV